MITLFASKIAPYVLYACGFAFFCLGVAFKRAGRPGKAIFDFICGVSLLIVAHYVATQLH